MDLATYNARRKGGESSSPSQQTNACPASNPAQETVSESLAEPQIGRKYSFTVFGEPQTAGSKQALALIDKKITCHCGPIPGPIPRRRDGGSIIVNVTDDNKDSDAWKKHIARIAHEEYSGPLFEGALRVEFVFFRERPKSHFTSAGLLNKEGRSTPYPITRPDVLKYARAAEDALTKLIWADDAIIVDEVIKKFWGSPARVEITVEELLVEPDHNQQELFQELPPWEVK